LAALNLKSQILSLLRLQEVDSGIYSLKNEKNNQPQEIKSIEAAFEAKKQNLLVLEKKSQDLQKIRNDRELELAANETSVKKLQGQLYSLKTNKEFQVMLQQIEGAKADSSVTEEKILMAMEEVDKVKKEIEAEKIILREEEKKFNDQKNKINLRAKEIDDRLGTLEAQRQQVIPEIDKKILAQYERILHGREGKAIVGVKEDSCAGCHMLVPPQVVNMIKMYDTLITCESCNRILYIPE